MYTLYFVNLVELYKYIFNSDHLLWIENKNLKYVRLLNFGIRLV